jgi:hypothetical protein
MLELVWVTKDGKRLLVSRMETSHIHNCIAKIERSRKGWRREYLERLKLELEIRAMGERT